MLSKKQLLLLFLTAFLIITIPLTIYLVLRVQEIRKKAVAPNLPDLDVTLIERTPRFNFDGEKKWPAQGETVTFIAHIKNRGTKPTGEFTFIWLIDNTQVGSGTHPNLAPEEETTQSYQWTWDHTVSSEGKIQGAHTIEFQVDPQNQIEEISETNNNLKDDTQSLSVGFWVEKSVYNFFNQNQLSYCQDKTCAGSNSWEDWAQRQIREWNRLFTSANPPILERVRLDKVTVVEDCSLPLSGGIADNQPDINDKTIDLM
ncbi:hypothetical protein COU95_03365 [Candidatus Shapirobacteria bacterium CG10_big_fil_rev_8_21_14_0_10_40_9]|uniref:CARDB domain-containing protein n=1 Tax=Candidatus Shapirobacteria bacterium CG10_big_fil_rev_8_21_14_0_10_40_9 TaxID=1974888 RepID=A0A2M8L2Y5_9BACT|nr:MAG: hypothetical protein COU95_03365 [Candidatus Shapirobacteria bacterium CG10_big_fil_rev_8_21_14_0_10_40_9]